jgi:5'-3' exonuclease
MTKYLIIDTANTFYRCRHTTGRNIDATSKVGLSLQITLSSVAKMWKTFDADHVIFCLEGRSWRKDYYTPYKYNRVTLNLKKTDKERDEDEMFWEAFDDLATFLKDKTNCTVLQHPQLEADDLIAGFVQNHPKDEHVIISNDSDFHQLIADNVKQFAGTNDHLITNSGIFDKYGKEVIDKKTSLPKEVPNPDWLLFEKCMRGDSSDNVFSAYPGVRKKGSKNKVGLLEAFADRDSKGFNWNNLMLQKWLDHDGVEHKVKDDYERNLTLIDLSAQPAEIRELIDEVTTNISVKGNGSVGLHFLRFCGKWDLIRLAESATRYSPILNSAYQSEAL